MRSVVFVIFLFLLSQDAAESSAISDRIEENHQTVMHWAPPLVGLSQFREFPLVQTRWDKPGLFKATAHEEDGKFCHVTANTLPAHCLESDYQVVIADDHFSLIAFEVTLPIALYSSRASLGDFLKSCKGLSLVPSLLSDLSVLSRLPLHLFERLPDDFSYTGCIEGKEVYFTLTLIKQPRKR